VAGDRAIVGASTAGERGRGVEDGLTGGVGGTEREAGARARGTTPTCLAHWAGGGREGENRLSARARAQASRLGLNGPNWVFLISGNFYCLFYLFSLGFSIPIQIKFQIQTNSNMCNNSKNI
jgi:hypothetical protein